VRSHPSWLARTAFLGVLALVLAGYVVMALRMEFRTASGRIGAGFFPQVIGVSALALCLHALLGKPSRAHHDHSHTGPAHTGTLTIAVLAAVGFFLLLRPLGAFLAASAYLLSMLALLNRRRVVSNVVVGVGLPLGLYLLFDAVLGASLPSGPF
jgi:hypothetical protein